MKDEITKTVGWLWSGIVRWREESDKLAVSGVRDNRIWYYRGVAAGLSVARDELLLLTSQEEDDDSSN